MTETAFSHVPVLPRQTIDLLLDGTIRPIRRMIDGTIGCGGHSALILERLPEAELLGIDRDDEALVRAGERLAFAGKRVHLRKGRFSELGEFARGLGWDSVDAILLDIGVSSPQIDDPKRGFSFRQDGPLDMRMDRSSGLSASRIVNQYDADSLRKLFQENGEMENRDARMLAEAIVSAREKKAFSTTGELAELCERILRSRNRKRSLPAPTLCFQALRMEVNGELEELRKALASAVPLLNPGGRLCVISFHSLEDRIVKTFFREMAETCKCPPGLPVCVCGWTPVLKIVTKHPVTADEAELAENPRAACAKLRAAEKIKTAGREL